MGASKSNFRAKLGQQRCGWSFCENIRIQPQGQAWSAEVWVVILWEHQKPTSAPSLVSRGVVGHSVGTSEANLRAKLGQWRYGWLFCGSIRIQPQGQAWSAEVWVVILWEYQKPISGPSLVSGGVGGCSVGASESNPRVIKKLKTERDTFYNSKFYALIGQCLIIPRKN